MIRLGCAFVIYKFQLIGKFNLLIGVKKKCSAQYIWFSFIFLKSQGFFFLKKFFLILTLIMIVIKGKLKVKEFCNRSGVAQRVPGGLGSQILGVPDRLGSQILGVPDRLGSQIFMTLGTWRWWGQPHAPATFTPRKCSWYSFSLGSESTPGPWNSWKEYVTEKSSDTTGNRCRDRPTSSEAP